MMEPESTYSTVCKLISLSMFGNEERFQTDTDWEAVFGEMKAQTVSGLVWRKLNVLPLDESLKKQWNNACYRIVRDGTGLRFHQSVLTELFKSAEIPYLILKGTSAAMYYPEPALRVMGDIDVYVPPRFYEQARTLMVSNGYEQFSTEEDNNRHLSFCRDRTVIELHRTFAMINGEAEKEYVDGLLEACCESGNIVSSDQEQFTFNAPPTDVNGIVLLEHAAQHMFDGLGLRQIVDWMMFANASLHDEEWPGFQKMASKAGLETLAKVITKMCCLFLGLKGSFQWCMDADEVLCDEVLDYLFDSGNFGRKLEDANTVANVGNHYKNSVHIFRTLQTVGEQNWQLYKKHRWLRPFAWLYQICRYFRQSLEVPNLISSFKKGSAEAKRRQNMVSALGVYREY